MFLVRLFDSFQVGRSFVLQKSRLTKRRKKEFCSNIPRASARYANALKIYSIHSQPTLYKLQKFSLMGPRNLVPLAMFQKEGKKGHRNCV